MTGRIAALVIVLTAAIAGIAMYYLQVYGYYTELPAQDQYEIATADGPQILSIRDFRGIDSDSSPLRYRACFTLDAPLPALVDRAHTEPLNAPGWFDCFDAETIGEDLLAGDARAVMVHENQPWGFDRVMALYPDGRAYVWPMTNHCGDAVFDGDPAPADCPPQPTR